MRSVRMFAVVLVMVLTLLFSVFSESAVATSVYDNAYQTTDHLTVGGTVDGSPVCGGEDVTTSWRRVVVDYSASFSEALNTGSWSVTQNYTYNNANSWQKIVDVFWAEDEPLQISYGYMGWGSHYSVNVSASAANKLHYGQLKANYIGLSGKADCELYFEEFDNSIYNFQGSPISWDLPSGAPSLHNFFVANASLPSIFGYAGEDIREAQPAAKYVAMGDSFSSGEGNPPFEYGTDEDDVNECHRSSKAYPRLLQDEPGLATMAFVACSGATTDEVISGKYGEDPQTDVLSDDTEVVTITAGGNDIKFKQFATACVYSNCASTSDEYQESWDIMTDPTRSDNLPNQLASLFSSISFRLDLNPDVKVYIIGYPYVITEASWESRGIGICSDFDEDEATAAEALVLELNTVIQTAVADFDDSRFTYVDPLATGSPFLGHELCTSGGYFNGVESAGAFGGDDAYVFHPNEDGQEAYASLIEGYMS